MNPTAGVIPFVRFAQSMAVHFAYSYAIRPLVSYGIESLYSTANSKPDKDSNIVKKVLNKHKDPVSASCNFTNNIILPLVDVAQYKMLATRGLPLVISSQQFIHTVKLYLDYHFIFRPAVSCSAKTIYEIANSEQNDNASQITIFLKDNKEPVSTLHDITQDILLPVIDMEMQRSIAITGVPLICDINTVNNFLNNKWTINLIAPFLRGANTLIDLNNNNYKNITAPIEIPARASEFTSWLYFFNFYLEGRIKNKKALVLTAKMLAIYKIQFLDKASLYFLDNTTSPFWDKSTLELIHIEQFLSTIKPLLEQLNADHLLPKIDLKEHENGLVGTSFFVLPLIKNPVSTTCKLSGDLFGKDPRVKGAVDTVCNFLGELSYHHSNGYMKSQDTAYDFNKILNMSDPKKPYFLVKSTMKAWHQGGEKTLTSALGIHLGYRLSALLYARQHYTKRLKQFFHTRDSSEYLDPDLLELQDFIGITSIKKITTTDALIEFAQKQGMCLDSPVLRRKILNMTNNLWDIDIDQDAAVKCTICAFYSESYPMENFSYPLAADFAALNSLVRHDIRNKAELCLEKMKFTAQQQPEEQSSSFLRDASTIVYNTITDFMPQKISNALSWFVKSTQEAEEIALQPLNSDVLAKPIQSSSPPIYSNLSFSKHIKSVKTEQCLMKMNREQPPQESSFISAGRTICDTLSSFIPELPDFSSFLSGFTNSNSEQYL